MQKQEDYAIRTIMVHADASVDPCSHDSHSPFADGSTLALSIHLPGAMRSLPIGEFIDRPVSGAKKNFLRKCRIMIEPTKIPLLAQIPSCSIPCSKFFSGFRNAGTEGEARQA